MGHLADPVYHGTISWNHTKSLPEIRGKGEGVAEWSSAELATKIKQKNKRSYVCTPVWSILILMMYQKDVFNFTSNDIP